MKVYNKDGKTMIADKDQMEIVLDAGWSKTKPEVETEDEKQAKIEAAEAEEATKVADKEAEEATKPKLKKIRKVLKKK